MIIFSKYKEERIKLSIKYPFIKYFKAMGIAKYIIVLLYDKRQNILKDWK